eukprot:TRINITY_DN7128_c0_g1_i2.p1 TRINITY_DN7128_c0_g1~~TRINITY_DN7128_c0_g1_i2.p1  ORF type:complete len:271 (-),score=61.03 TRINITY_DN7128_c0_g1_i2:231-1043(-)
MAVELYQNAMTAGDVGGVLGLATAYMSDFVEEANCEQAENLLKDLLYIETAAGRSGSEIGVQAALRLGLLLLAGDSLPTIEDRARGVALLEQAASPAVESPPARKTQLDAWFYLYTFAGAEWAARYRRFPALRQAAEGGHAPAMFLLGKWYLSDAEGGANDELGLAWLLRAARAGSSSALLVAGECFLRGHTPKHWTIRMRWPYGEDKRLSVDLFQQAVDKSNFYGLVPLAKCYKAGLGVSADTAKARELKALYSVYKLKCPKACTTPIV